MKNTVNSLSKTIGELGAGELESMATHALRDVVKAVRDQDGTRVKGKLVIDLTLERSKGTGQLLVTHKLSYVMPTDTGKLSEDASGDTLMYASQNGDLSILPDRQFTMDLDGESA